MSIVIGCLPCDCSLQSEVHTTVVQTETVLLQRGPALGENKVTKIRAIFYSIPIYVHEGFLCKYLF
jgi:hypothetical protein